jgi:hypothetical protein
MDVHYGGTLLGVSAPPSASSSDWILVVLFSRCAVGIGRGSLLLRFRWGCIIIFDFFDAAAAGEGDEAVKHQDSGIQCDAVEGNPTMLSV